MQISVDGFVAGPNGEMDWMVMNWDEALIKYVTEITEPIDTILLGRKLAEGFIPHWDKAASNPEGPEPGAVKFHETEKVVFSKTLKNHEWLNTRIAENDLTDEVARLKNQEGGDIILYGGGNFVSNMIKEVLIDEYHFFVNPTILGRGMPIFQELESRRALKLVNAIPFDCGIVVMCYEQA